MTQGAMWHEINEDGLSLLIEIAGEDPETVDNADAWVTTPDGRRWTATFMTPAEIARILDRWTRTGESLSGTYFTCPDLVIIREPGVRSIAATIKDLVTTGDHERVLDEIAPDDFEDSEDPDVSPPGRPT